MAASPDDLALAGLLPLLADDVFASAGCSLSLQWGGAPVAPGDDVPWAQVRARRR